jgi:peptide/nickel transport system substrate-binding protein
MRDLPKTHLPRTELSRREFVAGAAVGMSALGLPGAGVEAATPSHGGSIRIGLRSDVSRLDPHPLFPPYPTSNAVALLYNGLTEVDVDANIVPALAHAWEVSEDGLTWTWHIRRDVTFHSGRPLTGAAIKANIERVLNPRVGAIIRGELNIIDRLDMLDDYTLRITLKYPYSPLPSVLSNRWLPILDPQTFDTAKQRPVGTGPFKLVSWKRLHTTEMVRHGGYWEKDANGNALPYLDEITGKPLADDTVRLTALRTGEVDLIDAVSYRDQSRFLQEWTDKFDTYLIKAIGTTWYSFNTRNPPFDDVRVRRAAALALDKRAILDKTLFGHGEIMNQYYPQASPWHLPGISSREQDVDEAKRLLEEAGIKPGTHLTIVTYARYNYVKESSQIFQQDLRKLGFSVDLKVLDAGPLRTALSSRRFHISGLGTEHRMDPHEYYFRELSSKSPVQKRFYSAWVNPDYDELIYAARRTANREARMQLYAEAEKLIQADVPTVRVVSAHTLSAWQNGLQGYRPNVAGNLTYNRGGLRAAWLKTQ